MATVTAIRASTAHVAQLTIGHQATTDTDSTGAASITSIAQVTILGHLDDHALTAWDTHTAGLAMSTGVQHIAR